MYKLVLKYSTEGITSYTKDSGDDVIDDVMNPEGSYMISYRNY